jgi:AraC-like DNA-binding protein
MANLEILNRTPQSRRLPHRGTDNPPPRRALRWDWRGSSSTSSPTNGTSWPAVEAHLGRPVTIEALARQSGMSLSAFKREFRGAFGASPRGWLTDRRLDRARHLLARGDRNVTEVGLEVGFESVSHFIHRVRRRFAVTPTQFQMSQTRQKPRRP